MKPVNIDEQITKIANYIDSLESRIKDQICEVEQRQDHCRNNLERDIHDKFEDVELHMTHIVEYIDKRSCKTDIDMRIPGLILHVYNLRSRRVIETFIVDDFTSPSKLWYNSRWYRRFFKEIADLLK